ncbi:MAG: prepilin-type N-terminal cleavage/methylation domain-containing protein [Candidatus Acidiferrales bacterium]
MRGRARGFTLLEMMVVVAIVVILATIAAGQYQSSVRHAHEAALKSDLHVLRKAIQEYTEDKECGPSSLDDLVTSNYIGRIPEDPMTHQTDWVTKEDDISISPEQTCNGISDIHSASDAISPFSSDAYSSW